MEDSHENALKNDSEGSGRTLSDIQISALIVVEVYGMQYRYLDLMDRPLTEDEIVYSVVKQYKMYKGINDELIRKIFHDIKDMSFWKRTDPDPNRVITYSLKYPI